MRLMTFVGSPRRGGNTDTLADAVIQGFRSLGHQEVEKVFLLDRRIDYCTGCLTCVFPERTGQCRLHDDMGALLDEMRASDAFLFATANHSHSVSAPMHNFLCRMLPLLNYRSITNAHGTVISREFFSDIMGKRVAAVGSQGDPYLSSSLVLPLLDKIFDDFKLRKMGDCISTGNLAATDILRKEDDLKRAFALGVTLGTE